MKVTAVADGLHAIAVGPVNVFLLDTPDGLALIDAGLPDRADGILRAMHGLGRAPHDLRHIVLTHAHPDHIGSLAALVEATGAETWMHPLDAPIAERGHGQGDADPVANGLPLVNPGELGYPSVERRERWTGGRVAGMDASRRRDCQLQDCRLQNQTGANLAYDPRPMPHE